MDITSFERTVICERVSLIKIKELKFDSHLVNYTKSK